VDRIRMVRLLLENLLVARRGLAQPAGAMLLDRTLIFLRDL